MSVTINKPLYRWLVMVSVLIIAMIDNLQSTAVNLALPAITTSLQSNMSLMQWIITAYLAAGAALFLIAGRLSELFGIRIIFLFGLITITIAALLTGLAINKPTMVFGRLIQGIGFAFTYPMLVLTLRSLFSEAQQGRAIGILTGFTGLSLAFGPLFGGLILHYLNWRYIFLINIPFGIITTLLIWFTLKETPLSKPRPAFNTLGSFLWIIGLFLIFIALNEFNNLSSATVWIMLSISMVALLLFALQQAQSERPLIDIHVLGSQSFILASTIRMIGQFIIIAMLLLFCLLFENIYLYSAIHAGLLFLATTLIMGGLSLMTGRLIDQIGVYQILRSSLVLLVICCFLFTRINVATSVGMLIFYLALIGVVLSIFFPCVNHVALTIRSPAQAGSATGMYFTGNYLGGALGATISALWLANHSHQSMLRKLQHAQLYLTPTQLPFAKNFAAGVFPLNEIEQYFPKTISTQILNFSKDSFFYGFHQVMWLWFGLAIVALLLSFLIPSHPKPINIPQTDQGK